MYTLVLAACLTSGTQVPDWGCRGGCHGCWGCCGGCWGGCYGCGGCWGGCYGCWGGCYGCGGCWGGCYGCWGGCYGCYGGCYGCYGGYSMGCYGCYGGGMVMMSAGCVGATAGGGGGQGGGGQAGGGQGGGGQTSQLQDLKKSLEELKQAQSQTRVDALKLTADELRRRETDQRIDELRRDLNELRRGVPPGAPGGAPPKIRRELPPPKPGTVSVETPARITVRLPADARLSVDGVDCPLTSDTRTFDTPAIAPGQKFYYLLTAEVVRGGRPVAQTRRVDFRSGEDVIVSFEDLGANLVSSR